MEQPRERHTDVDVPVELRSRLGALLWALEAFMETRGVHTWRCGKEEGGRLATWWLYATLDRQAPANENVSPACSAHKFRHAQGDAHASVWEAPGVTGSYGAGHGVSL